MYQTFCTGESKGMNGIEVQRYKLNAVAWLSPKRKNGAVRYFSSLFPSLIYLVMYAKVWLESFWCTTIPFHWLKILIA